MWNDFKSFALKGNFLDLAIGVIIGAAFGKVVTSLVNDVLMPPLGLIIGQVDFSNLFLSLNGKHFESLSAARAAGAPTLNYGLFLNAIVDFSIVAFSIFLVIKQIQRLRIAEPAKAAAPAAPTAEEKVLVEIRDLLARRPQ